MVGDHGRRFHASALISSLEAPAPAGPEQGLERLERMKREWIPAASALLGARRRDFLAPLWRDIGRALDPAPFDPDHPERHASRAYREGLDWERLRRSVLAVPGYENEPALLVRLAEACWRLRERLEAIESWFALCHLAPEAFERLIEAADFPDWALRSAWSSACAACMSAGRQKHPVPPENAHLPAATPGSRTARLSAGPHRSDPRTASRPAASRPPTWHVACRTGRARPRRHR